MIVTSEKMKDKSYIENKKRVKLGSLQCSWLFFSQGSKGVLCDT